MTYQVNVSKFSIFKLPWCSVLVELKSVGMCVFGLAGDHVHQLSRRTDALTLINVVYGLHYTVKIASNCIKAAPEMHIV